MTKEPFWPWDEGYDDVPDAAAPDSHPDSVTAPISPPAGRSAHAGTHLPNGDSQ